MQNNKKISIIGLGYVGIPMLVCCGVNKKINFELIGIEKNDNKGKEIIKMRKKEFYHFVQMIQN